MKRLPIARCNEKRSCKGLGTFIQERSSYGGGIVCKYIIDLKTMKTHVAYVARSKESDRGVLLNYCPFCGLRVNKRWTSKQSAEGGKET